jgi:hypothetical protein
MTYSAPVCFSEGLASVLSDDGTTFSFIDDSGTVVLGPFGTPPAQLNFFDTGDDATYPRNYGLIFCEGRVRFYEDGQYGVIDLNGNVVVPARYDFITSFSDGTAEFLSDGKAGVIDSDGTVLLEPTDTWFYYGGDGTVILSETDGQVTLDLYSGERSPYAGSDEPSFMSSSAGGVTIQWSGGELRFPDATNVSMLGNGNFALTLKGNPETWTIVNRSGATVAGPFDGHVYSAAGGYIFVQEGESYDQATWSYWTTLYDEMGRRLLPDAYLTILPFDDR